MRPRIFAWTSNIPAFFVAPSAVLELKAAVLNRTSVEILWQEPEIKNGPLDGYVVEMIEEADSAVRLKHTVLSVAPLIYNVTNNFEA